MVTVNITSRSKLPVLAPRGASRFRARAKASARPSRPSFRPRDRTRSRARARAMPSRLGLVGLDQGKEYFRMRDKVSNFENLFENSSNCWKSR